MKIRAKIGLVLGAVTLILLQSVSADAEDPLFMPPGVLEQNSGQGLQDDRIYYSDLRFPLESGPAFANSQVYRPGGMHGGPGGQCAVENYSYPWVDNYCETRRWDVPFCPSGKGHQGQDIRPATCHANAHWTVAVEDGVIVSVGKYSVALQSSSGTIFRYLHLQMNDLAVRKGDTVSRGDRIGKVSNFFGSSRTTIHLHFDIKDRVRLSSGALDWAYVPPYTSLVRSYKELMGYK